MRRPARHAPPSDLQGKLTSPLRQLLLGLTLLGLLPLAVLTAVSIYSAQQAHRDDVQRATLDLARAVASAVEAELAASIWSLQALATSNELAREDFRALHAELNRFARARPDVQAISLADADGRVFLRTGAAPGSPAVEPVEPESLKQVFASGNPQVGLVAKGRGGEFAYPVRVPVLKDGKVRYVLTAAIRPEKLREVLDRQGRPADWVVAIFDGQGQRVARSRDHENTVGGPPSPSLRALLDGNPAREGVGMTRALEGDEIITAFSRIPLSGWVVAIGSPVSLLDAVSGPTLGLYAIGVGGSLLVAIPLAILLSRRIRRDIQMVVNRASAIGTHAGSPGELPTIPELAALMRQVEQADERVLEALDRADRAGAAKDQFLAVLGHELRNPLAPITNVLAILDRKAGEDTARERQILRRQVKHMTRLVDDLLDVAKLVEGKVSLKREAVDLAQLVADATDTFREQEAGANLQLRLTADRLVVDGDPVRLAQVVTNLLVNAYRHGAAKPISVEVRRREAMAEIFVADQGEGMTPETLAKVFEPFFQGRTTAGSLGLGLAIVRAIVERHGGFVRATSAGPGHGSTFQVAIPAMRQEAAPGEPAPAAVQVTARASSEGAFRP